MYTGIFPVADNESGLAAIMGHEVVHALARHGSERMSQGVLAQIGLVGASIAMGTQGFSPVTSQAAMTALGVGTQVGVLLPFSRAHESEADYIGLLLAADAGYDLRRRCECGKECSSPLTGNNHKNFSRPTRDTKPGSNGSPKRCPRLWRSTTKPKKRRLRSFHRSAVQRLRPHWPNSSKKRGRLGKTSSMVLWNVSHRPIAGFAFLLMGKLPGSEVFQAVRPCRPDERGL